MTAAFLSVGPAVRRCMIALATTWSVAALASSSPSNGMMRCGWFDNPTPGNATLVDRDGEWTIGRQGGHQAVGPWPRFAAGRWVRTGTGSAGHGCACLKVKADAATREISVIMSSRVLPLAICRKDKALKGEEPENPLR
jgi:hypothetical protein